MYNHQIFRTSNTRDQQSRFIPFNYPTMQNIVPDIPQNGRYNNNTFELRGNNMWDRNISTYQSKNNLLDKNLDLLVQNNKINDSELTLTDNNNNIYNENLNETVKNNNIYNENLNETAKNKDLSKKYFVIVEDEVFSKQNILKFLGNLPQTIKENENIIKLNKDVDSGEYMNKFEDIRVEIFKIVLNSFIQLKDIIENHNKDLDKIFDYMLEVNHSTDTKIKFEKIFIEAKSDDEVLKFNITMEDYNHYMKNVIKKKWSAKKKLKCFLTTYNSPSSSKRKRNVSNQNDSEDNEDYKPRKLVIKKAIKEREKVSELKANNSENNKLKAIKEREKLSEFKANNSENNKLKADIQKDNDYLDIQQDNDYLDIQQDNDNLYIQQDNDNLDLDIQKYLDRKQVFEKDYADLSNKYNKFEKELLETKKKLSETEKENEKLKEQIIKLKNILETSYTIL